MKQVLFKKTRTTVLLFKERIIGGGRARDPDGTAEVFYETTIDIEEMHRLARKAQRNKSKRAKAGALSVRVLEERRLI